MSQITYSQYCNNRIAHQNASLSNMEITYKGKTYSYEEFNKEFPIDGVELTSTEILKRESKKKK